MHRQSKKVQERQKGGCRKEKKRKEKAIAVEMAGEAVKIFFTFFPQFYRVISKSLILPPSGSYWYFELENYAVTKCNPLQTQLLAYS